MTTQRITKACLESVCDRINRITNMPGKPYLQKDGTTVAQIGNYHLSGAYGGYALHKMHNEGGGVQDIFGGHMPKRELYEKMHAFIRGLEAAQKLQEVNS